MTTQSQPLDERRPSRRVGYAVAVILNAVLLFLVNIEPGWQTLPFLTDSFADVLPLVNVSMWASLLANLAYDPPWFRATCEAVLAAIALAVSMRMLKVFPFDYTAYEYDWAAATRLVLWIAVLVSGAAILGWLVQLVRALLPHEHRT